MIVECGIEKFDVEPSQGTHFFQNVTSLGVGYLTINPFRGDGLFREKELDARQALYDGTYLRCASTARCGSASTGVRTKAWYARGKTIRILNKFPRKDYNLSEIFLYL